MWKRLLLLSITTMKMDNKLLLLAAPPAQHRATQSSFSHTDTG